MRKKIIAGAAVLALLMNVPQVSADDEIVIFGGEFEDEAAPPAPKKQPAQVKELPKPPAEKPAPPPKPKVVERPPVESTQPTPIEQPTVEPTQPTPIERPPIESTQPAPIEQPPIESTQPAPIEQPPIESTQPAPIEQPPIESTQPTPIEQPTVEPTQPAPIEQPTVEPLSPVEFDQPFEQPTKISGGQNNMDESVVIVPPTPEPTIEERSNRQYFPARSGAAPQANLKMLKPRFLKLAVDDTYTYYLDKTSVQWKKMPYSSSEYIADVWIRMIEREPADLDDDMRAYGEDNFRSQIALAREQGYQYPPEDIKVLRQQAYVLEHYYLRPKTNQIQFLCELEVFGRPQNAINERAYDYRNWENLVPGSVESVIYEATFKIIGKSKASERGHMTFIDMLEEYGRISLR